MTITRRRFLQSTTVAGTMAVTMPHWLRAEDVFLSGAGVVPDRETMSLVHLIDETPREKCPEMLAKQLKAGVPYRELMAAAFLFAALRDGHHTVYLVHGTHQLILEAAPEDRVLPLFWAVDNMKEALARAKAKLAEPLTGLLPSLVQAEADFDAAMAAMDREKCERAIIAFSRAKGAKRAYAKLLESACRDNHFIGHIPIAIMTAGRTLDVIGWHHAEPILRYLVRDMYRYPHTLDGQPYGDNLERAERTFEGLAPGWESNFSNPRLVEDLVVHMKQKKWWLTADWIAERFSDGRLHAGTVWDAITLLGSELMLRHKYGGLVNGRRALHCNTVTNALRFAFDTLHDSKRRYLTLLQAMSWSVESYITESDRNHLRDGSILDCNSVDIAEQDADVVDEILTSLPPRFFLKEIRDRAAQDQAAQMLFTLATRSPSCREFFQGARRILARKLTSNAHEMKYPIAMWEDLKKTSPTWRPHVLASTVHFLQSATADDCPAVVAGAAALR